MSKDYKLPNGWKKTTLGQVVKFGSGATKPSDISVFNDGEKYPVYGGNGIIGYSSVVNSEGSEIIIGRVGEKCECVHVSECACRVTDNALRIKEQYVEIYHKIFAEALKKAHPENFRAKDGQSLVTQTGINSVPIILPPLPEQKTIAEALTASQHEIELLKQLAEKYKTQKRGLMQKMLTDECGNRPIARLSDCLPDRMKSARPCAGMQLRR